MGRRLHQLLKSALRFITSWKLALVLAGVFGLCLLWAELFLAGRPFPVIPDSGERIAKLGPTDLNVGGEIRVAREECVPGTDSLFAIFMKSRDHVLVASLAKGCPDSNRHGFEPFIIDSLAVLHAEYPQAYYLFDMTLNCDTAHCYHYFNQTLRNIESVCIYIPSRCLYFEVYGDKVSETTALPYLEKMVYYDADSFEWAVLKTPEYRKKGS